MGTNTNTITLNLNLNLNLQLSPTRPKTKILCKNNSAFEENKQVSVDYDEGKHLVSTHLTGLRKADIQRRYRLRVEADRFQRDWTLSEVVHEILSLRPHDDIEGVLNRWIGRFARKNFPLLIREITQRGSIERSIQVFQWMKNQKNYCPRNDIYNMMIRFHARHNRTDQARGLFFEMQEWRYAFCFCILCIFSDYPITVGSRLVRKEIPLGKW
ncbi:pentatricopeptide repeat-containing protein At2g41720-like [Quercus lobata]|uniref:pentatricopeptide repeat-containing protein At2g41720-like n=1 Tax=Quercus lobata TaxID=97700 RepID=UPI001245DA3D|nr:pentatricopeptide repeat-containing protein At2g41720-like [Quercus lobata]